jgi:Na+/H+-dicarboxylate symporter
MMAEFTYTGDADPPDAGARGRSQTRWVVVAMLFGVAIGFYFPDGPSAGVFHATDLQLFSSVFLRMIKPLIAPLVFATLVVGVAVILGVDALMDMACTSLNVVGNCLATVLLSRWEGTFTLSQDDVPTQLSGELRGAPT